MMKVDTYEYNKFKKELPFHDRLAVHFYDDLDKLSVVFNKVEVERVKRLRALHNEILNYPMRPNSERIKWLKFHYGIKDRQAQYDLSDLGAVTGLLRADKNSERYEMSQFLRKAMNEAYEARDFNAVSRLATVYGKINLMDKNDPEPLDPARMYPAQAEPTTDVTVLGLTPAREGLKEELRKLFGKDTRAHYEDAQIVEEEGDPVEEAKTLVERRS